MGIIHETLPSPGPKPEQRNPLILEMKLQFIESHIKEFEQYDKLTRDGRRKLAERLRVLFGYSPFTYWGDISTHFYSLYINKVKK